MDTLMHSIIYTREKKILGKDLQDEINSIYFLVAKQKEKKKTRGQIPKTRVDFRITTPHPGKTSSGTINSTQADALIPGSFNPIQDH
jgi:hypothetical protein